MAVGFVEIALVLVIVAIFFGSGKLPQVFEALGAGVRQFREASKELDDTRKDVEASIRGEDPKKP